MQEIESLKVLEDSHILYMMKFQIFKAIDCIIKVNQGGFFFEHSFNLFYFCNFTFD